MALNIKDPQTDALARRLSKLTGESLTVAIRRALENRIALESRRRGRPIDRAAVKKIVQRLKSYSVVDERSPEELLGYDEHGLPR